MDQNRSILAILYHLYKTPLYSAASASQSELRVLVVDFGDYGRKFLDACLQSGQIRQKTLKVTVVAEREEERDEYLKERPALRNFFNVDGSLADVNKVDSFGTVNFMIKSPGWIKERPEEFLEVVRTVAPHYAFIAVGSDGDNLELARKCKEVLDDLLKGCVVNYVHASPYFSPCKMSDETPSFAAAGSLPESDWFRPGDSGTADVGVSPFAPKAVQDVFRSDAPLSERVVDESLAYAAFEHDRRLGSDENETSLSVDSLDDCLSENVGGLATMSVDPVNEQDADARSMSVFPEVDVPPSENTTVLAPVYVNTEFEKTESFCEFERMALNAHLATFRTFYEDRDKVMKDFREPSVYYSCLSSVLSLKYKLHSVGINLEKSGFEGAAKDFAKAIFKANPNVACKELIWVEHRRWATEKLCLGYQTRSIEECLKDGKTEGPKNHVALVRSRPDLKLETKLWKNKWRSSYVDYNELDDLDEVSLRLHRALVEKADELLEEFADPGSPNVFSENNLSDVREILEEVRGVKGKRKARQTFHEWFNCVRNAWYGNLEDVRQYERLKNAFLEAARTTPTSKENKLRVRKSVLEFDRRFYPIWARAECRNWKREYLTLIESIPFILTYSVNKSCLVVPFKTGGPSELFENLGAITFVAPKKAVYLFMPEKNEDREEMLKAFPRVAKYLDNKQIPTKVELIVLVNNNLFKLGDGGLNEIRNLAFKCSGGKIKTSFIDLSDQDAGLEPLEERLRAISNEFPLFAIAKNKTWLSTHLRATGVCSRFPNFAFDSSNMQFNSLVNCDWLGYIRKSPSLTLSDVLTLSASGSSDVNMPEFSDEYNLLWKIYSSNPDVWKRFCNVMYPFKNSDSVSFLIPTIDGSRLIPDVYVYSIHADDPKQRENLFGNCRKVVNHLRKRGVIDPESSVEVAESSCSVKVRIVDPYKLRASFDKLFKDYAEKLRVDANVVTFRRLAAAVGVKAVIGELKIDSLPVDDPSFSPNDRDTVYRMLSIFGKDESLNNNIHWGYSLSHPLLRDIRKNPDGTLSFFFVSRSAKELLTTAGKILELYTYHKLKETGFFDAVVSSCEINWEGSDVLNEIDCFMTKGFRTYFVECKAKPTVDQNYYYKLDVLTRHFGVNAAAILVVDTREEANPVLALRNKTLRKRGERMNIITVNNVCDVNEIGNKIVTLCERPVKRQDSF